MALTSKLMGQLLLQRLQSEQALASATKRNEAHPKRLRIHRPIIMKGAIQQIAWHPARLPANIANPKKMPITI